MVVAKYLDVKDVIMNLTAKCPLCGNPNLDVMDSPVFPFIAYRIWGRESFPVHNMHWRPCKFMFYDVRPEDQEMARLYNDYRGETYCREREQFEAGYSETNRLLKDNPGVEGERRRRFCIRCSTGF